LVEQSHFPTDQPIGARLKIKIKIKTNPEHKDIVEEIEIKTKSKTVETQFVSLALPLFPFSVFYPPALERHRHQVDAPEESGGWAVKIG
jgi:hypothetical protein